MKLYRGPRTTGKCVKTDAKGSKEIIEITEKWEPGSPIWFDGTIDKTGGRHSLIGVEIEAEEVPLLFDAYLRFQKKTLLDFQEKSRSSAERIAHLEEGLHKLSRLVSTHREKAPDRDTLLDDIEGILWAYWINTHSGKIQLSWINWDEV